MANTVVQNCQRGIFFITFLAVLVYFSMITISLIKKLIDPVEETEGDAKYQQGQEKPRISTEESAESFDHAAIQASQIKQDDPTIVKLIKRVNELKLSFFPLLIVVPLNILTGTSKAFSFVFYIFILIIVCLFNVAKIHRKCCEHKCMIVILENIWIVMLFFELLNVWSTTTTLQPYIII